MKKKTIGVLVILVALLMSFVSPFDEITETIWNNITNKEQPLLKYPVIQLMYDKSAADVYNIEKEEFYNEFITVSLLSANDKILYYKIAHNKYDFYKIGKKVTIYTNPKTGEIYIFDLYNQLMLILQLLIVFFIIYLIIELILVYLQNKVAKLYSIYNYVFKPLFYTLTLLLIINANIIAFKTTSIYSEGSLTIKIIHFFSIIAILAYIYVMRRLFFQYKKAKQEKISTDNNI
jgi:hypothetical protein